VPLVYKSFQYRIYPTEDQKKFLDQQFGGARFVYNFFLNRRKNEYLNNKKSLSYFDDQKALTELKTQDGYVFD
jgi:putative transposase